MRLTLILTKSPSNLILNNYLKLASLARSNGHEIRIYLAGNGVFYAKKGRQVAEDLSKLTSDGGDVFVSKEDLDARGLSRNKLIEGAKIPSDFFDRLVDDIMEKSQRVICF